MRMDCLPRQRTSRRSRRTLCRPTSWPCSTCSNASVGLPRIVARISNVSSGAAGEQPRRNERPGLLLSADVHGSPKQAGYPRCSNVGNSGAAVRHPAASRSSARGRLRPDPSSRHSPPSVPGHIRLGGRTPHGGDGQGQQPVPAETVHRDRHGRHPPPHCGRRILQGAGTRCVRSQRRLHVSGM